jgi:hypothetical protein
MRSRITVTSASGASITISTNGSTTYHEQASGSATDVAAGKKVIISVDGFGRGGGGGPTASAGPAASPQTGLTGTATDITVVP